jgi:hypothetical protein
MEGEAKVFSCPAQVLALPVWNGPQTSNTTEIASKFYQRAPRVMLEAGARNVVLSPEFSPSEMQSLPAGNGKVDTFTVTMGADFYNFGKLLPVLTQLLNQPPLAMQSLSIGKDHLSAKVVVYSLPHP